MYPMGARVRDFPARRMTFNQKVCLMLFCLIAVIFLAIIWVFLTDTPHEPPTVHHFSYRNGLQIHLAALPSANANLSVPAVTVPSASICPEIGDFNAFLKTYGEGLKHDALKEDLLHGMRRCTDERASVQCGHLFLLVGNARAKQCPEVQSIPTDLAVTEEHHFLSLQREVEKLRTDIYKMRSELRLSNRHIQDELANQKAETTNLTNKLDREIHGLRAQLEAAKYDVIKYCIGTLVSISAVGLAVVLLLL